MRPGRVTFVLLAATVLPAPARAQVAAPLVVANHPPDWAPEVHDQNEVQAGDELRFTLRAVDPDHDPLTYTVSGLPMGAKAEAGDGSVVVTWHTREADVGVYPLTLAVTDGRTRVERRVDIVVEESEESYVVPGVGYSLYLPNNLDRLGAFNGFSIEFVGLSWVHQNEQHGPSHGRVYFDLDVLFAGKTGVDSAFLPYAGFDLSVERNPGRRFLIPYFGMEGGVLFQAQTGTLGMLVPFAGLDFYARSSVQIGMKAGYLLPFTSEQFEDVRGLRAKLTLDLSFW